MKTLKDPLFISIICTGIAVGAGAFVAGAKFPVLSAVFLGVWAVLAVLTAVVLTRRRRNG